MSSELEENYDDQRRQMTSRLSEGEAVEEDDEVGESTTGLGKYVYEDRHGNRIPPAEVRRNGRRPAKGTTERSKMDRRGSISTTSTHTQSLVKGDMGTSQLASVMANLNVQTDTTDDASDSGAMSQDPRKCYTIRGTPNSHERLDSRMSCTRNSTFDVLTVEEDTKNESNLQNSSG